MSQTKPIFLVSLPRSGSTWLQRELCRSKKIASAPEPCFLLPLAYLNRQSETLTPYNSFIYERAKRELVSRYGDLNPVFEFVMKQVGDMIYTKLAHGSPYFIDKTPRYTLILEELFRSFPDATFLFLWRDPADVILSILRTWGGRFNTLFRYWVDFEVGLREMVNLHRKLGDDNAISLTYESLSQSPEQTLLRVFGHLSIDSNDQNSRSDDEIDVMLKSDLIGDQIYKQLGHARCQLTRGSLKEAKRVLDRIDPVFWEHTPYERDESICKIEAESGRFSLFDDFVSWSARIVYVNNLHGIAQRLNPQRKRELGEIHFPLE